MPIFYKNLYEGMRVDEALAIAQETYIYNCKQDEDIPSRLERLEYWAGWIAIGDMQAIFEAPQSNLSLWEWYLSLTGISMIGTWIFYRRRKKETKE